MTHDIKAPQNSMQSSTSFDVSRIIFPEDSEREITLLPQVPLLRLSSAQLIQKKVAEKINYISSYGLEQSSPIIYSFKKEGDAAQSSHAENTGESLAEHVSSERRIATKKVLSKKEKKLFEFYRKVSSNYQMELADAALCYCVCRTHQHEDVKKLLLDGANPNAVDRNFGPLLPFAITKGLRFDSRLKIKYFQNIINIAKLLIMAKADVNIRTYGYDNLLLHVFAEGEEELTVFIIEAGAELKSHEVTYLSTAIEKQWTTTVAVLLSRGVSPNCTDPIYGTALHNACSMKNKMIIKILIEWGANVNAINDDYEGVLDVLLKRRNLDEEILGLMKRKGLWKKLLNEALKKFCFDSKYLWDRKNRKQLDILLKYDADPNTVPMKTFIELPGDVQLMLSGGTRYIEFQLMNKIIRSSDKVHSKISKSTDENRLNKTKKSNKRSFTKIKPVIAPF